MTMYKLIFFALIQSLLMFSQKIEVNLEQTIINDGDFIGIDKFEEVYALKNNVLTKTSKAQTWMFKDFNLGEIYTVDLTNPLQILVFYKDLQTIVVLDNQLNEVRRVVIDAGNNYFIKDIGLSIQNKIWLFDEKFQRFGLYDMQNNTWHFFPYVVKLAPVKIFTNYNQMIWQDEKNEVYEINIFGQVNKICMLETNQRVLGVDDFYVLFNENEKCFAVERKGLKIHQLKILEEKYDKVVYKNQKLFIFTHPNILIYLIK